VTRSSHCRAFTLVELLVGKNLIVVEAAQAFFLAVREEAE
jgi:hypothetical protein